MTVNIIMFYLLIIYDPVAYSFLSNYDTEFLLVEIKFLEREQTFRFDTR